MKYTDNVSNNAKLKEGLENAVSKKLKVDDLKDDLTYGAKYRIAEVREFFKVSKTDVAKMLGTTYKQYLRFECDKSVLPSWVLSAVAFYFNLSLDFLSGASDEACTLYDGEYKNVNGHFLFNDSQLFTELPEFNPFRGIR